MPLEVEAKVALDGPEQAEALRARLQGLGAAASPAALEDDTFFAHPSRDLARLDQALRLRRTAEGYELTYKGPRQAGPVKARQELTVRLVDDPTALLAALGVLPTVRLRKARQRFRLGAVEATVDHLEGVGWFAEVEAVGEDRPASEAAVEAALRELGLAGRPRVAAAYVELALAAGASAATRA